jgi:hypothetical protein
MSGKQSLHTFCRPCACPLNESVLYIVASGVETAVKVLKEDVLR